MNNMLAAGAAMALAAGATLGAQIGAASAGHDNVVLQAALDGRQEVKTGAKSSRIVGDPNGRGEAYVFGVDGDPRTLCYVLTVDKIASATAAHIHKGARGTNGPVVVNLAPPRDGNAADCLTEGEPGTFIGAQTVAEILADPRSFYVNVHNAGFPGGAVRGQLARER